MALRLFIIVCALALTGCGGSGGSNTNPGPSAAGSSVDPGGSGSTGFEIGANFIKGPVTDGSCELFQVDASGNQGSSLGVAGNSVDGLVEFPDPVNYTGTVLLECSGGTYVDEATGNTLNAPVMRAVANLGADRNFVVSPLTEMAFQLAETAGNLGTALTTYNGQIAGLFGIEGDITEVLPAASLEDIDEVEESGQYLLALTLLSQMQADSGNTLTTLIADLASDLMDNIPESSSADAINTALDNLGLDGSESQPVVTLFQSLETALSDFIATDTPVDTTAPSGYTISNLTNPVNLVNQSEVRFSVEDAEMGARYFYEIYSSADGEAPFLEGSGAVSASVFEVTDLDLSQAGDGVIELRFYLTDEEENRGQTITATANKSSGPVENVTISGTITFDRVGRNSGNGALDYTDISVVPARGVTVEAVNSSGTELATTATDSNGQYSLDVTEHTYVRLRVRAEMISNEAASWNVSVKDNTNNDALYALQGDLFSSVGEDSIRDLSAGSGWTGSAYTNTRSAAPFAILDTVYEVMDKFVAVDPDIDFPALQIFWSPNNNTARGNISDGDIGSSFYSGGSFYILGDEDGDTDEYDEHIIAHEWGHYFEDRLSRSDSIGGGHGLNDKLDMRVAFGESWGNAISAIVLDDPIYTDSSGSMQSSGFTFDIEENDHATKGWYSEASAQSLLYDIYDSQSDDADTLSLGLSPIYDVFIAPDYVNTDYLTSIFVFLDKLREVIPGSAAGIDALALAQDINGTGPDGSGEFNDGEIAETLPLYKNVSVDGAPVELCSTDETGFARDNHNSLGARDFAYLEIASTQNLKIDITRVSGDLSRDPDLIIWRQGLTNVNLKSESSIEDQETWNGQLNSGNYVLEVYDYNITENDASGSQAACFELTVSTN
ncbi:MAG: hypothetical protein ACFHHU_14630 [Porticoccaceae bacterium]